MIKSLLRNSSLILLGAFVLYGCKAKKSAVKGTVESQDVVIQDTLRDDDGVIHIPGTINQKQLDSVKNARRKEKRNYKKK